LARGLHVVALLQIPQAQHHRWPAGEIAPLLDEIGAERDAGDDRGRELRGIGAAKRFAHVRRLTEHPEPEESLADHPGISGRLTREIQIETAEELEPVRLLQPREL